MPADSDNWSYRPLGVRLMGVAVAVALFALCLGAWISVGAEIRATFDTFQRITFFVLVGLAGAVWWALLRPKVETDGHELRIVNGFRVYRLRLDEIESVQFRTGAPWASVETLGATYAVMAIQGSDGDRAKAASRELARAVKSARSTP